MKKKNLEKSLRLIYFNTLQERKNFQSESLGTIFIILKNIHVKRWVPNRSRLLENQLLQDRRIGITTVRELTETLHLYIIFYAKDC